MGLLPVPAHRILVVRLSHLGDVIHALPVFHALREANPDAKIGWVVQREFEGLLRGLPGLDEVFPFDRQGGLRAWLRLRTQLREFRADLAVDAQGNFKSAAATWLTKARRRSGLARADWQEPLAARVLTDPAPHAAGRHALHRMDALAKHLTGLGAVRMDAGLSEAEIRAGEARADVLCGGHAPVALHLGATGDARTWPAARFHALTRGLVGGGRSVLLLAGPNEDADAADIQRIASEEARVEAWTGAKDLRELASLFAALGRRAVPLVCCDSGPMHLAAAHGMAVRALIGPTDPALTGPWPPPPDVEGGTSASPHRVVRATATNLDSLEPDAVADALRESD